MCIRDRSVHPGVGHRCRGQRCERLLDHARAENQHAQHPVLTDGDQVDVPHLSAPQRRVLHHRNLIGELREQSHRAGTRIVDVSRLADAALNRRALPARERPHARERVDVPAIRLDLSLLTT